MPDLMKIYSLLRLGGFFLFCFVGGAWLVYDGSAGKKGPVAFADVFPGIAAIAAGFLALGLILYLRRSSRDEEPVPAPTADPDPGGAAAPGRPWRAANRAGERGRSAPGRAAWFELTSPRRQLLVWFAAAGVTGGLLSWTAWAMNGARRQAAAARAAGAGAPAQRDEWSGPAPPLLPRHVGPQELARHEQVLDTAQKLARSVGAAPGPLTAAEVEAVSGAVAALREQQTRLSAVLDDDAHAADRARVAALRDRYSALIEQLDGARARSPPAAQK